MSSRVPVIVPAAGGISDELRALTGASARGLVPIDGRPMVDSVLGTVAAAETTGDVVVVCGPGSELLEYVGDRAVASGGETFLDTLLTGLEALGRPEHVVLVNVDLPLLTPEALDHFCREGLQSGASIVYPIIRKDVCERAFPGGKRLYVRLRDGVFTGGNLSLLSRRFIETEGKRLSEAFSGRKSPLRLCRMLGWSFVLRLLLGSLTVADIARRAEQAMAAPVHVVDSPYAEVGFDVDKPADVAAVEAWLAAHQTR